MQAAQFPGDDLWQKSWIPSWGEATIQSRSYNLRKPTEQKEKDDGVTTALTMKKNPEAPSFILYSSWFCPFAQRAWIVAEESGVNYQWIEINPYQVDPTNPGGYTKKALTLSQKSELYPGFVEASPRGLVPAIRQGTTYSNADASTTDNDTSLVLWESMPVCEYIDATFGSGDLAGITPFERARIQIWSAHCTDRIQKQFYKALMAFDKETDRQAALDLFYVECRNLANAMNHERGPFFAGERFTLVDVALAPFWQRILWVGGHYFGLEFPDNDPSYQRLSQWWEACRKRPSIRSTLVCKERLIASYTDYYRNVATSDFASTLK